MSAIHGNITQLDLYVACYANSLFFCKWRSSCLTMFNYCPQASRRDFPLKRVFQWNCRKILKKYSAKNISLLWILFSLFDSRAPTWAAWGEKKVSFVSGLQHWHFNQCHMCCKCVSGDNQKFRSQRWQKWLILLPVVTPDHKGTWPWPWLSKQTQTTHKQIPLLFREDSQRNDLCLPQQLISSLGPEKFSKWFGGGLPDWYFPHSIRFLATVALHLTTSFSSALLSWSYDRLLWVLWIILS